MEVLVCIAEEILKNLGSRALEEIGSAWGFKDRLNQLKITINTIKNVLLDAEDKQADSRAVQDWLKQLATAVYAADDLFDEFNAIATRKQLLGGNKVTREVQTFLSTSNQIAFAFKLSRKIKAVKEELEAIVKVGSDLGLAQRALQQGSTETKIVRDQTHSYVEAEGVIGRDNDKKAIIDLLIPNTKKDDDEELPVLPIVGIGGMGKTTIAQALYNDKLVMEYFELRLWVCVSEDFDIRVITEKILRSATGNNTPKLDMEQLQCRLRDEIRGKRYLLILDDVWEENANKWESLKALLKVGRMGSKILVTTRSEVVAKITGTFCPYILQGLSEEKSWDLFKKMAFKSGEAQQTSHLVSLGKQIVKKCANVPLAIVTLGRLCRCEDKSKWLDFKDKNLTDVMSILKLSYQHLLSPLKICFSYCALFPKDYQLRKDMLIELWIAEGFIINNANERRSLEDIAEGYFLQLLQRGFFQNAERDKQGEPRRCTMHDLMHDLAQEEAKGKCMVVKPNQIDSKVEILHLSFVDPLYLSWVIPNEILDLKMLRTFLLPQHNVGGPSNKAICRQLVTKLLHLRVLDLHCFSFKSLPRSIGNLIHLRYLDLTNNPIESLPDSIINLHNLQTLNLSRCRELRTLPSKIYKLVNLRSLDISDCCKLTHMPSGIGRLTLLHKLPMFIVGHEQSAELGKKLLSIAKLSHLKKLNNLIGSLEIHIHRSPGSNMLDAMEAEITNKHRLTRLQVSFRSEAALTLDEKFHDEAVLESIKPHGNLRALQIDNYGGQKLPSWVVIDNLGKTVPNLDEIKLTKWSNCQQLPSLSQLCFLKELSLVNMESVEYIESSVLNASSLLESQGVENHFFPSLERILLKNMKNLKGWWKEEESTSNDDTIVGASGQQHDYHLLSMQLSNLKYLTIENCPNMMNLPLCPNLKGLSLTDTNRNLFSLIKQALISSATTSTSSSSAGLKLVDLRLDDVEDLISLSRLGLDQLKLLILKDKKLQSTEILGEVFATLSSSLRRLTLVCESLRSISKGLEHLSGLECLELVSCEELDVSGNEDADAIVDMPWKALRSSLRELTFLGMPQLVSLPSGIQHLTNLRGLQIKNSELREVPEWVGCLSSLEYLILIGCPKLTYLPGGLRKLTSMKYLHIFNCPGLRERCQAPNGSDWPNIQHIPRVYVR